MAKTQPGEAFTFVDGAWHEGSPELVRPRDHGFWLASNVFDGARSLGGRLPDLDLHCQRLLRSAEVMGMRPPVAADEIEALAREGVAKFAGDVELYICPIFYPTGGFIVPDPDSTRFVLHVSVSPLPPPQGFSASLTKFRRPSREMAPTEA
ncbi:MAG: aminotransferase class IV, partial [Rhodospirillaceae bacterium]